MKDPYVISSLEELNEIYAPPAPAIITGIKTELHDYHIAYLKEARFVCIASGVDGMYDASPRGGEPGFVHVVDRKTIAIPDWRGNNKIETISNIVENGYVGLLFLFPGHNFFFRANGRAEVTRDPKLLEAMTREGKPPITAIRVHIAQIYLHCGKAIMRSRIWKQDGYLHNKDLPSLAKMVKQFTELSDSLADIEENNKTMLRDRLY